MGSDECERAARSADVALEILIGAYHALAVIYELSNPGAYTALHGQMMPYLRDGFDLSTRVPADPQAADPQAAALVSAALERIRCALDDVHADVATIRIGTDERFS
ncbi:hypothetical protein MKK88_16475 [Methylobacterium sp. E-005]|uniref:hypothetical protein n=1 Tax=Methylobacterium sp. E-005 TaxID=2836549 RepID=UPI001FBB50C1|nr:hypothetical protein [Methylobacterium sp. E-005]MCJ2087565.1 hypothetical protein [Methylobacterium sp. E-005]